MSDTPHTPNPGMAEATASPGTEPQAHAAGGAQASRKRGVGRRGLVIVPTYNELENITRLIPDILDQDSGIAY